MMLKNTEFYQDHLDRVSRSFAFCISQLGDPLRGWVGLSYLTCRILDTIEDAPWTSLDLQLQAFNVFDRALHHDSAEAAMLAALLPADVEPGELQLMRDAEAIFQDIHALPPSVRGILVELVQSMSSGMQHFSHERNNGALRLKDLSAVNQYCFFVAGIVGELLTKLLAKADPKFVASQETIVDAHHFGLFLQKVNLLKDQVGDEKLGRHLIPERGEVELSARGNAVHAFCYLEALPLHQPEFRRFCAWSLFLGLEALSVSRGSTAQGRVLKVPRERTEEILEATEGALDDSKALRALFQAAMAKLGWDAERAASLNGGASVPDWLRQIYRGPLTTENLSDLVG